MAISVSGNTFSVFSVFEALRRRKFLIIIPTILLAAGFSIFAYTQPNRYRAQALIAAEDLTPPDYLKHVAPDPLDIQKHLWTVREVLYSPALLEAAARGLKVYRDVQAPLPQAALDALKADVGVKVESEHTFQITYEGTDPKVVMDMTNYIAKLFTEQASAKRDRRLDETKGIIDEQLTDLKARLEEKGKEIRSYRQGAVNELPEHMDFNIREGDALRAQYEDRTSKIADEEARRTMIARQLAELETQGVLEQPLITEKTPNELRLDELRIREKELTTRYKPQHPEVVQIQREIREVEAAITNSPRKPRTDPSPSYSKYSDLKAQIQSIDQRIEAYRRDQKRLSTQIAGFQRRVESTPSHEKVLAELNREYHVNEQQYHALLDKQLDAKLAQSLQSSETSIAFTVVEPASQPTEPFSPRRNRLVLLGLFAGLGLGLVIAFLKEQNDTTFSNVDDLQGFTTLPLLGAIPSISPASSPSELFVSPAEPDSVAAEQFRVLAMKVQQHCAGTNSRIVLITSAAGSEGKSMTAVNLTYALASMAEGPVLLIDGDMRKPRIHEYVNVKAFQGRGVFELLQSPDVDYLKHVMRIRNFNLIPGSSPTGNPVAVLSSQKARVLFEKLRRDFRYIIVDAPPTLPVADSHLLAGLSDKILFVVRARRTPRELFQHAVESFDASNLIGAVLNDVDYQRSRYAYAYEYYKKSA